MSSAKTVKAWAEKRVQSPEQKTAQRIAESRATVANYYSGGADTPEKHAQASREHAGASTKFKEAGKPKLAEKHELKSKEHDYKSRGEEPPKAGARTSAAPREKWHTSKADTPDTRSPDASRGEHPGRPHWVEAGDIRRTFSKNPITQEALTAKANRASAKADASGHPKAHLFAALAHERAAAFAGALGGDGEHHERKAKEHDTKAGPGASIHAEVARGSTEFDEAKHPRDEHGRFS